MSPGRWEFWAHVRCAQGAVGGAKTGSVGAAPGGFTGDVWGGLKEGQQARTTAPDVKNVLGKWA